MRKGFCFISSVFAGNKEEIIKIFKDTVIG